MVSVPVKYSVIKVAMIETVIGSKNSFTMIPQIKKKRKAIHCSINGKERGKPMKYAVEARIFNNGKIIAKVRPAEDGEESHMTETKLCDIWVDVFDSREEAEDFCKQYRRM